MNKLIFSFLFLFAMLSGYTSHSQKIVSKISKEICNCLGSYNNVTTSAEVEAALESCIMKSSLKHIESIRKELGIDMTQGEVAGRKFGEIIAYELIRKCDTFLKYIMLLSIEPDESDPDAASSDATVHTPDMLPYEHFSVDTMSVKNSDCLQLHSAKYTYQNDPSDKLDYFIIDGKTCTEYHDNGTFVSHYTIRWKSDCEYESTFVESNNPEINNLLEKGDKVAYRVLGVYGQYAYIQLSYKGFSKTFKMLIEKN